MLIRDETSRSTVLVLIKILTLACLVLPYFWFFSLSGNLNLGFMLILLMATNFYFFYNNKKSVISSIPRCAL